MHIEKSACKPLIFTYIQKPVFCNRMKQPIFSFPTDYTPPEKWRQMCKFMHMQNKK